MENTPRIDLGEKNYQPGTQIAIYGQLENTGKKNVGILMNENHILTVF